MKVWDLFDARHGVKKLTNLYPAINCPNSANEASVCEVQQLSLKCASFGLCSQSKNEGCARLHISWGCTSRQEDVWKRLHQVAHAWEILMLHNDVTTTSPWRQFFSIYVTSWWPRADVRQTSHLTVINLRSFKPVLHVSTTIHESMFPVSWNLKLQMLKKDII